MSVMSKQIWPTAWILLFFGCVAFVRAQDGAPTPLQLPRATAAEALAASTELLEDVSRLRSLKIRYPVKSGVKSRAEIERVVITNFDEAATPEEVETQRKRLVAFGLIPKDFRYREFMISLLTEQVAGFYQAKTREFFLADWNDLELAKPVVVHELTHALQDQHFDLSRFEKWPRGDGDRELAIQALIEGDATALMFNYILRPQGLDVTRLPISLSTLNEIMSADPNKTREKVFSSAPAAIRESLLFPYSYGAGFAQEMIRRQGWDGLSKAYSELPQSTEQIMHVEKYLSHEAPVKIEMADLSARLGVGWKRLSTDINGEFGYFVILAEFIARKEAQRAAEGWGGDKCALYENARTGDLVLVHLSAWDSTADADEFFKAYCTRVTKRYPGVGAPTALSPRERSYATPDGETLVELKQNRVLIIEGMPSRLHRQLRRVVATLLPA